MSIFWIAIVIGAIITDPSLLCGELLYMWALFAIADALWVKIIFGGK